MAEGRTLDKLWDQSKGKPIHVKNVRTGKIDRITYKSSIGNYTGRYGMYPGFHPEWVLASLAEIEESTRQSKA